ncbi:hypothetical protein G5I_05087 [Acromyrmex echinatior]|uniref:Uncharacterized protein n=1 Tax=Acromyrmex echinatior TaxID=103372 RepID=F4WHC7_ACREC|nr:hypothetical protein G5I_05087 [Acromyrmex echinatior]
MRSNIGYRIMHPLLSQLRIRSERHEASSPLRPAGVIEIVVTAKSKPLSGQFRNDVNERNDFEYLEITAVKFFRLHRQLEASMRYP